MGQLIDTDLKERLLASIAGDSLIILCGAGLSMAPPSNVSSAWEVSQSCVARYKDITGQQLPREVADNIEALAEYFF